VIGIDQYQHNWPPLKHAVSDAENVEKKLRELDFNVFSFTNEKATRDQLSTFLTTTLPKEVGKEDMVFIYFAGHGETKALARGGEEGYIIPFDGNKLNYYKTAISMKDVIRFADLIPAKHIFYVIDACYSGFVLLDSEGSGGRGTSIEEIEDKTRSSAVQIITAGKKGEPAQDGLFTKSFLLGLDGKADLNQDQFVTATEIAQFVKTEVSRDSGERQHPQYGWLYGDGEVVFRLP
jgi:uncharacterized caspase-like protein